MAKIRVCDCCKSSDNVKPATMDEYGIHEPRPILRQEGLKASTTADLCESCRTALAFKWEQLKKGQS